MSLAITGGRYRVKISGIYLKLISNGSIVQALARIQIRVSKDESDRMSVSAAAARDQNRP